MTFIATLMSQKVPFIVVALAKNVDPFTLHIYAALAEQERRMFSRRTKEALQEAKARGVKLGRQETGDVNRAAAAAREAELGPILRERICPLGLLPTRSSAAVSARSPTRRSCERVFVSD